MVGTDVAVHQIRMRIEISRHFICLNVQLTAVQIVFCRHEIEKGPRAAGQVSHSRVRRRGQCFRNQTAKQRRGEKLPVLDFFLGLAVRSVIFVILPAQSVQAAVTGIQVIDIAAADPILTSFAAINQIQQLFIGFLPSFLRYSGIANRVFHFFTSISGQEPRNSETNRPA